MDTKPKKMHHAWWIVIGCGLIMFGTAGPIANCMGNFMKPVSDYYGFSMTSLSLYFTIMTITMAVVQPLTAKLYEKLDIRILSTAAVLLAAVGMMLMAVWNFIFGWYISAVLIGIAFSVVIYTLIPIIINRWFSKKAATWIGVALCINGAGGAVFSAIAGSFISNLGFKAGYVAVPAIGLIFSLPATIFMLRSHPSDLGLKPWGYSEGDADEKQTTPQLVGYTRAEAIRKPVFYLVCLMSIFVFFCGNLQTHIVNFAYSVGMTTMQGATVGTLLMLGNIVGRFMPGVLNDRFGVYAAYSFGAFGGLIGLILFLMSGNVAWFPYVGGFFFGFCMSQMAIVPPLLSRAAFGAKDYANIFVIIAAVGTSTSAIANPIYGAVYDKTGTYQTALIIGICFLVAGLVVSAAISSISKKQWGTTK